MLSSWGSRTSTARRAPQVVVRSRRTQCRSVRHRRRQSRPTGHSWRHCRFRCGVSFAPRRLWTEIVSAEATFCSPPPRHQDRKVSVCMAVRLVTTRRKLRHADRRAGDTDRHAHIGEHLSTFRPSANGTPHQNVRRCDQPLAETGSIVLLVLSLASGAEAESACVGSAWRSTWAELQGAAGPREGQSPPEQYFVSR
jgi:hypothetical protein